MAWARTSFIILRTYTFGMGLKKAYNFKVPKTQLYAYQNKFTSQGTMSQIQFMFGILLILCLAENCWAITLYETGPTASWQHEQRRKVHRETLIILLVMKAHAISIGFISIIFFNDIKTIISASLFIHGCCMLYNSHTNWNCDNYSREIEVIVKRCCYWGRKKYLLIYFKRR